MRVIMRGRQISDYCVPFGLIMVCCRDRWSNHKFTLLRYVLHDSNVRDVTAVQPPLFDPSFTHHFNVEILPICEEEFVIFMHISILTIEATAIRCLIH